MRKMSRNSKFGVRSSEFGVSAAGSRNDFEGTEKLDRYCCFDFRSLRQPICQRKIDHTKEKRINRR